MCPDWTSCFHATLTLILDTMLVRFYAASASVADAWSFIVLRGR